MKSKRKKHRAKQAALPLGSKPEFVVVRRRDRRALYVRFYRRVDGTALPRPILRSTGLHHTQGAREWALVWLMCRRRAVILPPPNFPTQTVFPNFP